MDGLVALAGALKKIFNLNLTFICVETFKRVLRK
jgi:hypothetical protein